MTITRSIKAPVVRHVLAGLTTLAALATFAPAQPAAAVSGLRFVIEDSYDVTGDGLGDYLDYRLLPDPNEPSDVNYCIETQVSSVTFLFFNRDLDGAGGSGTDLCDESHARRQFFLRLESADACAELMSNNYGWPDGAGGCITDGYRNPRIRVDKLMVSRPRTTPIDFLIGRNPLNPIDAPTYRIESDGEASISVAGADRTITYGLSSGQTFRLVKVGESTVTKGKGGSTPAWAQPFVMTVRMTFTLATVTQ